MDIGEYQLSKLFIKKGTNECFFNILLFLSFPFAVKAAFPAWKNGLIYKLKIVKGCLVRRLAKISVLKDH